MDLILDPTEYPKGQGYEIGIQPKKAMSEYLRIHPVRKNPDSDFRYLSASL